MRTIRGFSTNPDYDIIYKNDKKELKMLILHFLNSNIKNQKEFDEMHYQACKKLIAIFEHQLFTVGQAQKWINMTFKYLHLLEYKELEKYMNFVMCQ